VRALLCANSDLFTGCGSRLQKLIKTRIFGRFLGRRRATIRNG
jgi:hypothetical protein